MPSRASSMTPPPLLGAAILKRRLEALEEQIALSRVSQLRGTIATNITKGRAFRRAISMFQSISDLVTEGECRELQEVDPTAEDDASAVVDTRTQTERDRLYRGYEELLRLIPSVTKVLEDGDVGQREELFKQITKGSDNARGDDAGNLKPVVVTWINLWYGPSEPPLSETSKTERGLENDFTGMFLCPAEYNWADSEVRAKIREGHGDFVVTALSWPTFLYAGYKCDIEDVEKGLFRGAILVKVFRFLFTSPTSVCDGPDDENAIAPPPKKKKKALVATRTNVAGLIGLRNVTPRAIAYVAVQLRFALSGASSWNEIDGDFHYIEFYNAIIDYFEAPPGPVAKAEIEKLLIWWNQQVFKRADNGAQRIVPSNTSTVMRLAAQRKEREEAA